MSNEQFSETLSLSYGKEKTEALNVDKKFDTVIDMAEEKKEKKTRKPRKEAEVTVHTGVEDKDAAREPVAPYEESLTIISEIVSEYGVIVKADEATGYAELKGGQLVEGINLNAPLDNLERFAYSFLRKLKKTL